MSDRNRKATVSNLSYSIHYLEFLARLLTQGNALHQTIQWMNGKSYVVTAGSIVETVLHRILLTNRIHHRSHKVASAQASDRVDNLSLAEMIQIVKCRSETEYLSVVSSGLDGLRSRRNQIHLWQAGSGIDDLRFDWDSFNIVVVNDVREFLVKLLSHTMEFHENMELLAPFQFVIPPHSIPEANEEWE